VPELLELACPLVRRCARFHANKASWQFGKEFKKLCSTNTLADHHRAIGIDAVNLKHRLRNIDPDRANLAHGRLPSMWLRFDATTYGTSMPQSGRRPPHHSRPSHLAPIPNNVRYPPKATKMVQRHE
jgi:hypothetical protein